MGLFNLVSGGIDRLFVGLDTKMTQTMEIGLQVMRAEVHTITHHLQHSIGGGYNQKTKTAQIHIDATYGLLEATRGPTLRYEDHDFITPGCKAMGKVWGGNFEIHLPHAILGDIATGRSRGLVAQERKLYRSLGRRTTIVSRRHHKRFSDGLDAEPIIL